MSRVAFVMLYGINDAALPVAADIDEDGRASLWSRPEDMDVDELSERTGMTRREVLLSVEEKAAQLFMREPADDEDPPRFELEAL
ncbi:MAG TPA: hypothetical protein VK540_16030 [Polyangiaceae bacterium]|nr:hypothetical protein [Polyangiaceae bacterium]